MLTRLLFLAVLLTAAALDAAAQDRHTYSIWLKGIECLSESHHVWGARSDEPFVIVHSEDRYNVTRVHVSHEDIGRFDAGTRRAYNLKVWEGPVQNVDLHAQLWEYDRAEQNAMRVVGVVGIGAALGVIGAATGGAAVGAAAGAGGAGLGFYADEVLSDLSEGLYDFMGQYTVNFELHRVGRWADAPQERRGNITYDLTTDHEGDGARYRLYWEVRRR
ncbi:MAG: hypothetical protein R3181_08785 [Rubricoccaceae bacterium]|nr:hypothetical protein [Rubricoccaceae bacterium]